MVILWLNHFQRPLKVSECYRQMHAFGARPYFPIVQSFLYTISGDPWLGPSKGVGGRGAVEIGVYACIGKGRYVQLAYGRLRINEEQARLVPLAILWHPIAEGFLDPFGRL